MKGHAHVHGIDHQHQDLDGEQREQRTEHTQGHRLEQKLNEDEGVFGADGLLDADDLRSLSYRNKHDVGDGKAPDQDGEDANEPDAVLKLAEDAVDEGGEHLHLVDREI